MEEALFRIYDFFTEKVFLIFSIQLAIAVNILTMITEKTIY